MAFQNQFALSLELTRLIPQVGWAANQAANAILRRARDLRHSGSDLVTEEDLTNIFGRCRIAATLSSSFKTVMGRSSSNIPLIERIGLQGLGPTTFRAMQEAPYFAMVVQLSMLVWTFDINYLATAISDALRDRLEDAPSSFQLQSTPDRLSVLGVLKAVEKQTLMFNWNMMLHAVSLSLYYKPNEAPLDFPPFVLQGLLDMFPMVQTLPNDRIIQIQLPVGQDLDSGASALVVWAHHILDLTVLVRPRGDNGRRSEDIRFGCSGSEQLIIEEVGSDDDPSIILLDAQKESLLAVKPKPDRECNLIGSVRRIPARGWGNVFFEDWTARNQVFRAQVPAVLDDLQTVTIAFATIISEHLVKDERSPLGPTHSADSRGNPCKYHIDETALFKAAQFLFDNNRISRREIEACIKHYANKPLDEALPLLSAMDAATRAHEQIQNRDAIIIDEWNIICYHAKHLSVFLLGLANLNINGCEDLLIVGSSFCSMDEHPLAQQVEEWNGIDDLIIADQVWLQALTVALLGYKSRVWDLPWEKLCLVSQRGWSVWISNLTFGEDLDPIHINAGSVCVGRGTPCRNGVWKTGVWDSLQSTYSFISDPEKAESYGDVASLRCAEKVSLATPYCGEGDDMFVVSSRIRRHKKIAKENSTQRFGFKEISAALWWSRISEHCSHGNHTSTGVKLPLGCATVAGFGNYLEGADERIIVWLTAHSVGARWLALATTPTVDVLGPDADKEEPWQVLLRRNDCCFQCVVDQAAERPGKWFVIL